MSKSGNVRLLTKRERAIGVVTGLSLGALLDAASWLCLLWSAWNGRTGGADLAPAAQLSAAGHLTAFSSALLVRELLTPSSSSADGFYAFAWALLFAYSGAHGWALSAAAAGKGVARALVAQTVCTVAASPVVAILYFHRFLWAMAHMGQDYY